MIAKMLSELVPLILYFTKGFQEPAFMSRIQTFNYIRWAFKLIILSFLVLLSGCASLSKKDCVAGDWQSIGKQDGNEGHKIERFQEHKKACHEHGVEANLALYKRGREEGLKSFCQVQRQLDLGIEGLSYRPVCSGPIVPLLREAHDWGYRGFKVKDALSETKSQLASVREQMHAKNVKTAERERLRSEEGRLESEVDRLRYELIRMKAEAERTLSEKAKAFTSKT